ncbi:hypothetical protein VE02_07094 [Pseudogymnoascus sp. 03VT05]|nr:hypothetical protein VE02_07094 [Pseudogymnoascus sp. 03VT05]
MYPNNFEAYHPRDNVKHIHHFSIPEHANIPGRVTINDLPSELLLNIIRYIPDSINSGEGHVVWPIQEDFPRYNSRSLLQLALCSHYFHELTDPILYERFHHGTKTSTKGFLLFLKRILSRPDLGRSVRIFHMDGTEAPGLGVIIEEDYEDKYSTYKEDYDGYYDSDFDLSCFTAEDLKDVRKKIAEASTTTLECYEWAMAVEKGDLNALIAPILTLTPNLQVLDIDMWTRPDSVPPILTRMLAQAGQLQRERRLGHQFALWGLNKVMVRCYHALDVDDVIHHLTALLTIPSVEILCAIHEDGAENYYYDFPETNVNEEDLEAMLQGNSLGLANIKELSLSIIPISLSALLQLWCYYPNLKKFSYRDSLEDGELIGNDALQLEEVKDINLMAKASHMNPQLQDLAIFHRGFFWSSILTSSISSLATFKCLRHLETTWPIFTCCGDINEEMDLPLSQNIVDAIPLSLEQLGIFGGPYQTKDHHDLALAVIFKLLQQKYRLPALNTLDFGWKRGRHLDITIPDHVLCHEGFTEEDYLESMGRCQGAGVELILKPVEQPHPGYISFRVDDDGNTAASGFATRMGVI